MRSVVCLNIWYIRVSPTISVFDLLFVFLELLYPLYLCENNDKCFVCLTEFLLFQISLYFLLWGKKFTPAKVLRGETFFPSRRFFRHKFVRLQNILTLVVPLLYNKFALRGYCLRNHGLEMEYKVNIRKTRKKRTSFWSFYC